MIPRERLLAAIEPAIIEAQANWPERWQLQLAERIALVTGMRLTAVQRRLYVILGGNEPSRTGPPRPRRHVTAQTADLILTGLDLNEAWHLELADLEPERADHGRPLRNDQLPGGRARHASPASWRARTNQRPLDDEQGAV